MPFLIYSITSNTLRGSCTFRGARPQTQRIRCILYSGGFTQKKRARQGAESNATEPEILIRDSWRTRPTRLPCQRFVIMVAQHYSQVSICSSSSDERKMSGKEVPRGDTIEQTIRLFYKLGLGGHDEMMRQCHKT